MSRLAIERQVITTWHTPEERMPEEHVFVVATISLKADRITYDHALAIGNWCTAEYDYGWIWDDPIAERFKENVTVHAWADLEPYAGNVDGGEVHYEHG
jgi:hypothetical protein